MNLRLQHHVDDHFGHVSSQANRAYNVSANSMPFAAGPSGPPGGISPPASPVRENTVRPAMAIPPRGHDEKEWRVTTETIQLLTPEGERVEHPGYPLDDDVDIKGMYRDMVLVRRIDSEAIAL